MGDVAKGIKVLKGMSDDTSTNNQDDKSKSENSTLKTSNQMPQIGWLEILSVVIISILVLPKRISVALKKLDFILENLKIH